MANQSGLFEDTIPVSRLLLDPENPRLPEIQGSQRETIAAVAQVQGSQLVGMAKHITEYGLNPAELPIVMPTGDDPRNYYVLDGNRRINALKVLETPELAQSALKAADFKKIKRLSQGYVKSPIDEVRCIVSPSTTPYFLSPLRYPGGKRKLANFIRLLFYENNLLDGEYAELYAGGASVALSLLYGEFVTQVHINDIDPAVSAFWNVTLESTEVLTKRIHDVAVNVNEWERQRSVQESNDPDPVDLAFSTFFLNRTNRSGIIKGGVIGGKAQTGRWKLDARFNKRDLIGRIEKVARYRSRIKVYQLDGADFICNVLPSLPSKALVYLDPLLRQGWRLV